MKIWEGLLKVLEVIDAIKKDGEPGPSEEDAARDALLSRFNLTLSWKSEAKKHAANLAKQWAGIAADPPDPQFRQQTILESTSGVDPLNDEPLSARSAEAAERFSEEAALGVAFLHAVERYQGAQLAGDGEWALAHARQMRQYAALLANQIDASSAAVERLRVAIAGDASVIDSVNTTLRQRASRIATVGFTAEETREARNLGLNGRLR